MWPFRKKPVAVSQLAPKKPSPVGVSPLLEKASAELIAETLPRVFQRTHADLTVPATDLAVHGAAMDSADDYTPPEGLYSVQDTLPAVVFSWFGAQSFIGHQACAILAQHWLIAKACGQAPKDAVQNGFKAALSLPDGDVPPDLLPKINKANKDRAILTQCREAARNSRIFGIRHVMFLVDGIDYTAPFNLDGVRPGSYRGISQIDPYWLVPEFDIGALHDPSQRHFYEPTWWRLPNGLRVHRSHFVILREGDVPDVLKPTYMYGGLPLPQLIYERVYAAERTANEAPELALTKRLITMKASLENYLTDQNEVTARLNAFNQLRSNFGFLIVGEDEDVTQIDTSLADFDALLMSQYQLVAAIAGTPATKLLGTSPKGFNATGEHESDSYDQELVSIQTTSMTPILDRHHDLLCRSDFSQYPGLSIATEWNPPRAAKEGEKADIALKKAQTAQAYVTAGVVSPEEERARLVADTESGYSGLDLMDEPSLPDDDDTEGFA